MKALTQFIQMTLLRVTFRLLGLISPQLAANRTLKLMSTPRRYPEKAHEQAVLNKAKLSTFLYRDGKVQLYRWGEGNQTALLVHGWEGRAGNFGGIIEALLAAGWSVIAFDAPSHGQSVTQPTSMFDFVECLMSLIKDIGPDGEEENRHPVDAVVAHSFGCVAATVALSYDSDLSLSKLVMIASPNRFEDRLQQMVDLFRLSSRIVEKLRPMLQEQANYPIFDFTISDLGNRINVKDRLLLHDKADKLSLHAWSQQIADQWSQDDNARTQLITIEGTGHNRILWDEGVINHIARFLSDSI